MSTVPVPKTSRKGPIALTIVGAVCLIGAAVVAVIAARLFMSAVPFGVVNSDGSPGSDAVGGVEAPGELTLTLAGETTYAVYLAHSASAESVELADAVTVTGPNGAAATRVPGPSGHSTSNDVSADTLFTFRTGSAGEYTLDAPPLASSTAAPWARIIVTPQHAAGGFIATVLGSIVGVFVTIGLGGAGVVMVIAGAIWWYTRSKARKRLQAGQWPAPGGTPGVAGHGPGQGGPWQADPQGSYPAPGKWHQQYGQVPPPQRPAEPGGQQPGSQQPGSQQPGGQQPGQWPGGRSQ